MNDLELRPWERYWTDGMSKGKNFLRSGSQLSHPSRTLIAEETAKFETVLECGCATAIDYPFHAERGTKYTGIDITQRFVDEAQEHNPGVDVRWASILDLPFEDHSFDTVYCRAVLEHMHPLEWPLGVKEMWRVADKQMILAFFGWRADRSPKKGQRDEPKSIIERMEKDQANREGGRMAGPPGVFNKALSEPDIIDVLKWVGAQDWVKKEVGGARVIVNAEGVQIRRKTGWKRYHIYVVEK